MQVGYARASTIDQEAGFQAQLKALTAAGCEKVFSEAHGEVDDVSAHYEFLKFIQHLRLHFPSRDCGPSHPRVASCVPAIGHGSQPILDDLETRRQASC
jgi:hypothetical protein